MKWLIHAAAPCPPQIKQAMLDWWGPCVYEYYAATEGGGTIATPADWLAHPGTVGRAWPNRVILLASLDGRLARMKWPRTVDFTTEMPRDPTGKLRKRELRDPYWAGRERPL